jgi:putative SOS response-associated peptidase YedK
MCYKVATPKKEKLEQHLKGQDIVIDDYEMFYHADGFTRPFLPVQLNQEPKRIQPARWKLLPYSVKNEEEAKKSANTLNARGEEIFTKYSYKPYIKKYRCLLWVDGFYEPHHPTPKETQYYYVYRKDGAPFTLGCVYAPWVDQETKEGFNTFSIITTPPNNLLTKIHNEGQRMPLYIPEGLREAWLKAETIEEITSLIKTYPDGELTGHPVSKNITKRGFDSNIEDIQACVDAPNVAQEQERPKDTLF